MELILEAPLWLLILCFLAGAVYAAALYTKDRLNRHFKRWVIVGLAALRFSAVTLIAFFLLRPLVKSVSLEVEKPVVVIAQDNSESLVVGSDSSFYKNEYSEALKAFALSLGDEYEVQTYQFGSHTRPGLDELNFSEKSTDYSTLLDELYTTYSNRNLGALVVASDGRYNKGVDPVYAFQKLNAPIFTIALGDTTARKDIRIAEIAHNRLAYLGNRFPVEIRVTADELKGEKALLSLSRKGQVLFSQSVSIDNDASSEVIRTTLPAENIGLQQYSISISNLDGEITYANNRKSFFIDVLDSRQKVLLLYKAPHPDVRAIREAISTNANYEVKVESIDDFDSNPKDFSLVILHQLPHGGTKGANLCAQIEEDNIPAWYIWGSGTNFNQFDRLNTGFSLRGYNGNSTDAGADYAKEFSLFKLEESTRKRFRNYPPLTLPFGNMESSPGITPLLLQRVGQIETDMPLLGFNKSQGRKIGVTTGEGLWRWRLFDYLESQNHEAFDELVSKTVQFLASKDDKSQFRVTGNNDFLENEEIRFNAELYNDSYEPVNDPEVTLVISSEDGNSYDRVFTRAGEGYRLNAGSLPVGQYSYVAKTLMSGKDLYERGEFSVSPVQLELTETRADHRLLYNFAHANGGEMVYPGQWDELKRLVTSSRNVQSVSHETKVLSDLINTRWILFLILGLLCMEWLWRKRNGTY